MAALCLSILIAHLFMLPILFEAELDFSAATREGELTVSPYGLIGIVRRFAVRISASGVSVAVVKKGKPYRAAGAGVMPPVKISALWLSVAFGKSDDAFMTAALAVGLRAAARALTAKFAPAECAIVPCYNRDVFRVRLGGIFETRLADIIYGWAATLALRAKKRRPGREKSDNGA